jgi:hypothetical protein
MPLVAFAEANPNENFNNPSHGIAGGRASPRKRRKAHHLGRTLASLATRRTLKGPATSDRLLLRHKVTGITLRA